MRNHLVLFLLLACPLISAQATHYPVATVHSVKCIEHNDTSIYVLMPEGIEVINKVTGQKTIYKRETGYFVDQWNAIEQSGGNLNNVGQNALAIVRNTIFVGGNDGVLTRIHDGIADTTRHYLDLSLLGNGTGENLSPIGIESIVVDSNGTVVIGGTNCISVIYPSGERQTLLFPKDHYGTQVWKMVIDSNEDIWISCTDSGFGNGLMKYHVGGELQVISDRDNPDLPFKSGYVKGMTIDNDGCLWFASSYNDDNGWRAKLLKYNGSNYASYDVGESNNVPISVKCDSQGRIWFLPTLGNKTKYEQYSKGPLCCFDHGEITRYEWDVEAGYCYCVDVDGDSVYVGTDNGVLVFSDGSFHWLYDTEAGMAEPTASKRMPSQLYDLQGRPVQGSPKHGVYIQNGKKVMR